MSTLNYILICIAIYAFIGLIVGIITRDLYKGCFWIFYLLDNDDWFDWYD